MVILRILLYDDVCMYVDVDCTGTLIINLREECIEFEASLLEAQASEADTQSLQILRLLVDTFRTITNNIVTTHHCDPAWPACSTGSRILQDETRATARCLSQ